MSSVSLGCYVKSRLRRRMPILAETEPHITLGITEPERMASYHQVSFADDNDDPNEEFVARTQLQQNQALFVRRPPAGLSNGLVLLRILLGVAYLVISLAMFYMLFLSFALDNTFGEGKGVCHSFLSCLFSISWATVAACQLLAAILVLLGRTGQRKCAFVPAVAVIIYLFLIVLYFDVKDPYASVDDE